MPTNPHKFVLRVSRPGVASRLIEVPAADLEDAARKAQEAGWTIEGGADADDAPGVLDYRAVKRAVFIGTLQAHAVLAGVAGLLTLWILRLTGVV